MNQQILYSIAKHRILIITPNAKVTEKLITSFKPFKLNSKKRCNTLFQFSGNKKISIPNKIPDDVIKINNMTFEVYHLAGDITISATNNNNKRHSFNISADKKTVSTDLTLIKKYESHFLAYFLRSAYGIVAASYQTIKIHASVIEKEGKALVFMGKSGTGKSTHSKNWLKFIPNCQLLNDDEPILRIFDNGSIRVYGAPWSGSTPCYRNTSAKVVAFVRLYQNSKNKLTPLKGANAFAALYQSAAILRSDKENREQIVTIVNNILKRTPIYRLDNKPDCEAVYLSKSLLK